MPGGKRRRPFSPMDTNPTSIQNMLVGLEMADRVDQSFVKVHFHKMTTEYSSQLIEQIVDKEAEKDCYERIVSQRQPGGGEPDEDNYESKRKDNADKVPITKGINDQQKKKRLKKK